MEPDMKRAILLAATVMAAFSALSGPASADYRGNAPWCAVYSLGFGSVVWDCRFASVEACRPHVIAGNRGFCNHNPGYKGPVEPSRKRARRLAHHY
jgi:hypothetical protein